MSAPTLTGAADKLAAALPTFTKYDSDTNNWAGHHLCGAIGAILDAGASLTTVTEDSDTYPGWTIITSPADAPAAWLTWQADLYGVDLIIGQTEQQDRTRIADLPAQKRGTPDAMVAAAAATLTGTQTVGVVERLDSGAYGMAIRTRVDETADPAATEAAARTQKPGAVVLTYVESDTPLVGEYTLDFADITADLDVATLADVT